MYIAQICYYDPQSAGINVQSPQGATTPRRPTLVRTKKLHKMNLKIKLIIFSPQNGRYIPLLCFHLGYMLLSPNCPLTHNVILQN
jgi:hypothetical protein